MANTNVSDIVATSFRRSCGFYSSLFSSSFLKAVEKKPVICKNYCRNRGAFYGPRCR